MMDTDFAQAFFWLARATSKGIVPIVTQLMDAIVGSWDNIIVLGYVTPRQRHAALYAKGNRKRIAKKWIHKGERNWRRRGR